MSERAHFLVDQCIFWLWRAEANSLNAGRPAYWRRRCFEEAVVLIGAGC